MKQGERRIRRIIMRKACGYVLLGLAVGAAAAVPAAAGAVLSVKPLSLEGVCAKDARQVPLRGLVARNLGRVASDIEARGDVEWLRPSPGCVKVRPGGRCPFTVQVDCGAFAGSLAPVAAGNLRLFAAQANSGVDVVVRIRLMR
jgi:hypothetical protein